jgi:hypothetical protein
MQAIQSPLGTQIIQRSLGREPFEANAPVSEKGLKGGAGNYYGAFSIQNFVDQATLSNTHADARGWLNYVTQFRPSNFWLGDSGVVVWEFIEGDADWDDWQDTYGLDSCDAIYYSGHGGMDANGVFFIPLGADWGGRGHYADSTEMVVGDDHTRYVFWSTCNSVRVTGGMDPIKTWFSSDRGWRMIFGFESTSVDSPDYGSNFWSQWNQGKSFSQAWLDASWAISTTQAPSVVAGGTDQNDANNRLYNERLFSWDPAGTGWFQWRWYYAASAAARRALNMALPEELLIGELVPFELTASYLGSIVSRFELDGPLPAQAVAGSDGCIGLEVGGHRVGIGREGAYEVELAKANRDNRTAIAPDRAVQVAQAAIGRFGLNTDTELVFDRVRQCLEAGGSEQGSGTREGPFVVETTVQFRQLINGLPVVTPGTGTVLISVDNDGSVTSINSSTRAIDRLTAEPKRNVSGPPLNGAVSAPYQPSPLDPEQQLAEAWSHHLGGIAARGGRAPSDVTIVPDSTEVGYEIESNVAYVAARRVVDLGLGNGCRKQHALVAPLVY